MGLRELDSGAPPPLGARLGTDRPAWDEPHGVLRDWDMVRGFLAGGLGVTWRHVPAVAVSVALPPLVLAGLCCVAMACASGLKRRRRVGEKILTDDGAPLVSSEVD